jgi:hypothetical protein
LAPRQCPELALIYEKEKFTLRIVWLRLASLRLFSHLLMASFSEV